MKTFNVPQFYNWFCYYFKSTCFSFNKVIKLFTLSCLHPFSKKNRVKTMIFSIGQTSRTCPQVPCVIQKGSKKLDLRKWSETWCRSQLPALKGVEGSCWKLRDQTRKRSSYSVTNLHPKPTRVGQNSFCMHLVLGQATG